MPSTNELYRESLLHQFVDGKEKSPTILSVLLILKGEAIKSEDLPLPAADQETDCTVCYESLRDAGKDLVILTCGHFFHQACIKEWLKKEKQWDHPDLPDDGVNEAEHGFGNPVVEDGPPVPVDEAGRQLTEVDRTCVLCRFIVFPAHGYDMTKYEQGIAPEEAEWILRYFEDEQYGEERKIRLNDNDTIGVELQAAHEWAREQYYSDFRATKERKTAEDTAKAERRAEERDDDDDDYEPPGRKRVKRSPPRPLRKAASKQNTNRNGRRRKQ